MVHNTMQETQASKTLFFKNPRRKPSNEKFGTGKFLEKFTFHLHYLYKLLKKLPKVKASNKKKKKRPATDK